ncbi:MAG TPA: 16S rRNA (guanine(966)-N(2))-methyltransferase RsmD [Gemmataceae bacterium]|nr:16S rRNA (guanine(966)-N(2))-methyltransferase RsmD [Gemmataceae bacterium]
MRVQLRIVAGALRGRKLTCNVSPDLRPTPDRVREALFNILGDAVPDRPFVDVFAGSGVVGLEALSRGAKSVLFLERDFRLAQDIDANARAFGYTGQAKVLRTDVYRWAATWHATEPINVYVSPPFADIQKRTDDLLLLIEQMKRTMPAGSVLVVQGEKHSELDGHPALTEWEERRYGRNLLLIWEPGNQTGERVSAAGG